MARYRVGQELENLDRFIAVNRLAFHKILKKYKKRTGSPDLGQRFYHVLSHDTSFVNRSLVSALAHYNELLAAARAASFSSEPPGSLKPRSIAVDHSHEQNVTNSHSTAADIQYAYENGTDVDLDTALAVLPQDQGAGRACYWVHNDNLLQIQILLLRYTRSRKNQVCTSAPTPSSLRASRHGSCSSLASVPMPQSNQKAGTIVCDELERFVECRSGATLSDSESESERDLRKPAATIRYSSNGEAVLTIGTSSDEMPMVRSPWRTARLKRKALGSLFQVDEPQQAMERSADADVKSPQLSESDDACSSWHATKRVQSCLHTMPSLVDAKSWLYKHRDVQPLVEIQTRRTRFAGIRNTDTSGVWAVLDTEIVLTKCSSASLAEQYSHSSSSEEAHSPYVQFPHAILTIRFEGGDETGLIKKLDNSHLTERVRGFSLDTHAVATLYNPSRMPPPYWLPLLDQDIRKVPNDAESDRPVGHARTPPQSISPRAKSNSATSITNDPADSGFSARLGSSETSVPDLTEAPRSNARKKGKPRRVSLRRKTPDPSQRERVRYWNEFDDGDEGKDNNAYTILLDPNASSSFPGVATLSRFAAASANRIKSFFHRGKPSDLERQPLLGDRASNSQLSSEDSDLESGTALAPDGNPSHLSLLLNSHRKPLPPYSNARDNWLTGACIACFILAFVMLLMETILINTGRRKAAAETDVGVFVGVAFSLALGVAGLGATAARMATTGWVWWSVVSLLFVVLVVGNGVLLTMVL